MTVSFRKFQMLRSWFDSEDIKRFASKGHAHIWYADLARTDGELARFASVLDDDERSRSRSIRCAKEQRRFVARRGILRFLLGTYLDRPAFSVPLRCLSSGQLVVKTAFAEHETPLHLSASHSGDLAVFAFANGLSLGVDVERLEALPAAKHMAALYFTPQECAALERVSIQQRDLFFMRCWTRKEAYIKATGEGLRRCLRSFTVMEPDGEPAKLQGWTIIDLRPPVTELVVALVVAGPVLDPRYRQYPNSCTAHSMPPNRQNISDTCNEGKVC